MLSKYPQAAKYIWQTKRMPVDKSFYHKLYIPKVVDDVVRLPVRLVNKFARTFHLPVQLTFTTDMNPIDQWYRTNSKLRDYLEEYYQGNINRITDDDLRAVVKTTFEKGGGRDKIQAVNLLAVYKRYF